MPRKSSEPSKRLVNNSSDIEVLPFRERLKNWLSVVQSMLTIVAILVGAAWFVQQGDPFAKATISAEFDRLVNLYRTKGYLRFGREEMIGLGCNSMGW